MNKFIIGILFWAIPFISFAHNSLSARYYLESTPSGSVLTINLSQTGVNQLMSEKYNEEYFLNLDEKAWKELIVNYVKENFTLKVDGVKIALAKGGIRLGNHQTDLKFILPALPQKPNAIFVNIPAFKENGKHQTILAYNILGKANKVILNQQNNYKANIDLYGNTNQNSPNYKWLFIISGILILLALIKVFKAIL